MINITNKEKCSGCGACVQACPKHCIQMIDDEEGFAYPVVDKDRCVSCNLCNQVCPLIHLNVSKNELCEGYCIYSQDSDVLKEAAAGGAYYAIAEDVISHHGIVYGVEYGKNFEIRHNRYRSLIECKRFCGSKYVQSNLYDIYQNVYKDLYDNNIVCFSGLPCQIYGLQNFLGKHYQNLITVDLACAGVPSHKIWEKYIDMMRSKYKSEIASVNFRNKTYGYLGSTMKINFQNGKSYSKSGRIDPMMFFFTEGMNKRPICYNCPFKGIDRRSDITLFDSWHMKELTGYTSAMGSTNVIVHSKAGSELINRIAMQGDVKVSVTDVENAIKLDGKMIINQPSRSICREKFYTELNDHGVGGCIKSFMHVSLLDYLIEDFKPIFYKLGLISRLKKVRFLLDKIK